MNDKLEVTEELKELVPLKELAKGEEGQFIQLLDIQEAETKIAELAEKYEGLEVTEENYKKEAANAEQELRQSRYTLQNINKANNKFLNGVKKEQKEIFERLIAIIKPQEERLKKAIDELKEKEAKAKEEEAKREKERIEKIQTALRTSEATLEKALIRGRTNEDLEEYDNFLSTLKEEFETFEEMEFEAKKLHAIYTGKRKELVAQIEQFEEEERKRAKIEAREKEETERKYKAFEMRKAILIKLGLAYKTNKFYGFGVVIKEEDLMDKDELEFFELQEEIREAQIEHNKKQVAKEQAEREAKAKAELNEFEEARKAWDEMFIIYQGLGGDPTAFRLRKDELPSQRDIKKLREMTKDLQEEKREKQSKAKAEKLAEIKEQLEPFKIGTLDFLKELERYIKQANNVHEETKSILVSFEERLQELVNEVFGEVYNK